MRESGPAVAVTTATVMTFYDDKGSLGSRGCVTCIRSHPASDLSAQHSIGHFYPESFIASLKRLQHVFLKGQKTTVLYFPLLKCVKSLRNNNKGDAIRKRYGGAPNKEIDCIES